MIHSGRELDSIVREESFSLPYARFTFHLNSLTSAILPPYLGSALRGVLGRALREVACMERQRDCKGCMFLTRCAYAYVFETNRFTVPEETGQYHVPHPFVLEPPLEQQTGFAPGEGLSFGLILLGQGLAYLPYFITAFQMLDKLGLGAARHPFSLVQVDQLLQGKPVTLWKGGASLLRQPVAECLSAAAQNDGACSELTVYLVTPARLVSGGKMANSLDFPMLMRALFRRLVMLGKAHGQQVPELPFQELLQEAAGIEVVESNLAWQDWERYSSRQRTKLQMGGLVGSIRFRGDLQPFLAYLRMGKIVHLGKGTVFGLGKMIL